MYNSDTGSEVNPEYEGPLYRVYSVFTGEHSDWSETQTLTIEEVPTPSPSPEPAPFIESPLIFGVIAILAVVAFGLVLLYRIKRK